MSRFTEYVGVDYSGAKTPTTRLGGLRIFRATETSSPEEEKPPHGGNWTRKEVNDWLCNQLSQVHSTIVGIDHGFSFPLAYFDKYGLSKDWSVFLDDFQRHCPTDEDRTCVSFIRTNREGESSWMRLTEKWTAAAKSVFLFNTNGGVAHSTYAGLPWLRQLKQGCAQRIHFWPFDGWDVPGGRSVVAEVYPSLWKKRFPKESLNSHQQDAYAVAAWFRRADQNGTLPLYFNPPLTESERTYAQVEGWILGVV